MEYGYFKVCGSKINIEDYDLDKGGFAGGGDR